MEIKVYSIKLDTPPWLRRAVVYFAIPAAAILGVSAVVYANVVVPNTFQDGNTLYATTINANFKALETEVNRITAPGSADLVRIDAASTPNGNTQRDELAVCPTTHPVPVSGGCYAGDPSVNTWYSSPRNFEKPADWTSSNPDARASWHCRFITGPTSHTVGAVMICRR